MSALAKTHETATAVIGSPVLAAAPHQIGVVTLIVHDLDATSRFYEDVIGLSLIERDGTVARLGVEDRPLLDLVGNKTARRRSPREAGLFHTAFLVPERADLGAWIAFASERRIRLQGAADHLVSEALYLADPEGNGIEIYVDKPAAVWPVQADGIAMSNDPLDADGIVASAAGRRWRGFPALGTIGHLHLQVGNLPEADRFYGEIVGFDITCRYPGASFFGSGGYHHQLAANIWNSRGAGRRELPSTGLAGFELIARDDSVVAAARGRLAAAGLTVNDLTGGLSVDDPWGTRVSLSTGHAD